MADPSPFSIFRPLNVAIIGGGIGGLSAAVALRRAGHQVTIYERRSSFDLEVGASISCAANGVRWLREWGVDCEAGRPVKLMKLMMRDWKTGDVLNEYDLGGYEEEWKFPYLMFHRQDQHRILLEAATSPDGQGPPCKVILDHDVSIVDAEQGTVLFKHGFQIQADLIVGADGIRSVVREQIGVEVQKRSAPQTCYRCNVTREEAERLGLEWAKYPGIQFWGGYPVEGLSHYYKIVMSPCAGGDIISLYLFMPTELTTHQKEGFTWAEASIEECMPGLYSVLDPKCRQLIQHSIERKPWRLYVHEPYSHWHKGKVCVLGDAAKPMMPHQSQGAVQAIEDAAALGIIFSSKYPFTNNVTAGLQLYEAVRKPRGTRVQVASKRALENLNERIGFSSLTAHDARLKAREGKLTINELNGYDMHAHIAEVVAGSDPAQGGATYSQVVANM